MNDDIQPATLAQVKMGASGKFVTIDADVGEVVQQIKQINPDLHVRHSEAGNYFVVYYRNPITKYERMVTTAQELDKRLVNRMKKLNDGDYDYLAELARLDAQADTAKEAAEKERIGEMAERLAHALRQDLGVWKDSARSKKRWGAGLVGY